MLRKITFLLFLTFVAITTQAQDAHFSQFYANPLYLNPALAGSNIGARFALNYRNQWPEFPGNYVTYAASYDQYIPALSGGIGIQVMQDLAGETTFKTNSVAAMYSYNLNLNRKWSLKAGFQAAYQTKTLNWNNLVFGDQIDARLGITRATLENVPPGGETNANYFDFSTGLVVYSEKLYFGGAVHHLTQPNESLLIPVANSELPMKFTGHVGSNLVIAKKTYARPETKLSPNIIYMRQREFQEINFGTYITRGPIVGGAWYRIGGTNGDALILLAGISQGMFRFGYSFDVTTSDLKTATAGSHEISLGILLEPKKRTIKKAPTRLDCPSF